MKNKLVIFLSSILLGVSSIFVPLFNKGTNSARAITSSDTTSYVTVNELWDSANQKVNKDNLLTLFDYVSGTLNTQYNTIEQLAEGKLTSKDMRENALSSYNGSSIKEEGKDIIVTLGGLKWQVVYLSENISGEPVLTLMLANNVQDAWSSRTTTEGEYYGFLNGGLYSVFSSGWRSSTQDLNLYQGQVYSTSYVRVVTLNNGGQYAASASTLSDEVEKNDQSVFAMFTMDEFGLTKYIETPNQMPWQLEQSYSLLSASNYDNPNEAVGKDFIGNWSSIYFDHTLKDYYYEWGNDYIWLPSITEMGSTANNGIWQPSAEQRKTYDGSTRNLSTKIGTNGANPYVYTMTRSGRNTDLTSIQCIYPDGTFSSDFYTTSNVRAIRPALHLNLNAMMESLANQETTTNKTIYLDTVNGNDNSTGLTEYMAVKSLDLAVNKVENNGEIVVMNPIEITEDCVLGQSKSYTLKRYYKNATSNYQGVMFTIGVYDAADASNNKCPRVAFKNVVIDCNQTKASEFDARDGVIDVINGNLSFEDGSGLKNHNGCSASISNVGYAIELFNGSNITINGGTFDKNYNFYYGTIVHNGSDGKIIINGGTFTKNHTNHWGLFFSNYIEINGGIFGGWVDTNEDGIYQTNEGLGNSAHNDAIIGFGYGTIIINNGTFYYNFAPDGGGSPKQALFSSSKMIVNGGYFANNYDEETRETQRGGAIFNVLSSLEINGGLFENNKTKKTGGVISLNNENCKVSIKNATFKGNSASVGGVIATSKGSNITIEDCIFEDNSTTGSYNLTLSDGVAKAYSGGGVIYAIGSNVTIKNSTFTNNKSNGDGGAIQVVDGGLLEIYDCTFINNDTTGSFGGAIAQSDLASVVKVYGSYFDDNDARSCSGAIDSVGVSTKAVDCIFKNNKASNGGAVRSVNCQGCEFYNNNASVSGGAGYSGSFIDCYFEGNTSESYGGALAYVLTIKNCYFIGNSTNGNGGAVGMDGASWFLDANIITINDCSFTDNLANSYGGAIYVNKGNLKIINSTVTENSAGTNGGGIYFSTATGEAKFYFGEANKQNKIIIENNTKTGGADSNLFLVVNASLPVIELVTNLEEGSVVYVESSGNLFNQKVAQITGSDKYITQQTIDAFEYKEGYDFYAKTLTDGLSKTGVGLFIEKYVTDGSTLSYIASDNYCDYDGLAHTINIQVYSTISSYQIYYSDSENGTYSTTPITVREPGESKVVWFYIEEIGGVTTQKESYEVKISRMDIVIAEGITINTLLGFEFEKNSILPVTMSGKVVDVLGNAVAVDLVFNSNNNMVVGFNHNNTTISVNVIPKNTEKYNKLNNVTATIKIAYDDLYFSGNKFYIYDDLSEEGSFATSVANLEQVVTLLNNNATIYFLTSYTVSENLSLESDNNIYLSRLTSNTGSLNVAILIVSSGATLNIGSYDMKGRITITGGDANALNTSGYKNANDSLISNGGTLNLTGNVVVENARLNKTPNSGVFGAGINSAGTLNLDGTSFINLYTRSSGGAIYSTGAITANNITIENCYAIQYGAGIYSLADITLTNSIISNNIGKYESSYSSYMSKGVGIAVVGNVNVKIENCKIIKNQVDNNSNKGEGGGIYFAGGVNATITNSSVQQNYANLYGSGLFADTGANVVLTNVDFFNNSTANANNKGSVIYVEEGAYVYFVSGEMALNTLGGSNAYGQIYVKGTFDFGEFGSDNAKMFGDSSSSSKYAGAIYVDTAGLFNMYGGIIQGFQSTNTYCTIYVANTAKAYIYSGTLYDNTTSRSDWGVYQILGDLYINTNVYVNNTIGVNLNTDRSANIHVFGDVYNLFRLNFKFASVKNAANQYLNGKIFEYDTELSGKTLTEEEWEYLLSKVIYNNETTAIGSSTIEYVYDSVGNQYYAYLNPEKASNQIFFNPKTGSDSNTGTELSKPVQTWSKVLTLASTGSTVYLCDTWEITADTVINGAGITLSRASSVTTYMFNITTANVTLTINNLIIDGRKYDNGVVYADEYLLAKAVIYSEKSCTINLNDTTIQNNATATSGTAIHLKVNANNTNFNLNLNKVKITNNTIYTTAKGKYMGVGIYVENTTATHTNPEININIKNSDISNNTIINEFKSGTITGTAQLTDTTNYGINNVNGGVGIAFNLAFNASSVKAINLKAFNTRIEDNQVEGATFYSGVALLVYAEGAGNDTNVLNITTEKCEFINNGTTHVLSNGVGVENVGAINFHTSNSVKVNVNFIDTNFFDNNGYESTLYMNSLKDGNVISFDGCSIDNEAFKLKFPTYNGDVQIVFAGANNTVNINNSSILNATRLFVITNNTSNTKATLNLNNVNFENCYRLFYLTNINLNNTQKTKSYNCQYAFSLVNSNVIAKDFVVDGNDITGGVAFTLYGSCDITGVQILNYPTGFSKENVDTAVNLNIKDCFLNKGDTAFTLQFGSKDLTSSNTGKTAINIEECIIENYTSRGIYIINQLYTSTSTTYQIEISVKNTTIKNCNNGIETNIINKSIYPSLNLNLTNTTIENCINGYYNKCASSVKAISLTGGYFINNNYGLYATARLDFKDVVALNNNNTDVYAPLIYLSGKNSIGTMYCVSTSTTSSIYLTGSISGSQKTNIKLDVSATVGLMIIAVDSSYTPTQTDFNAFLSLFNVDGATLDTSGLSIVISAIESSGGEPGSVAQTNIYYFDPENKTGKATASTNGTTINAPFLNISQVLAKANSNVTVYVMSKATLTGTFDFKGMTFKVYFNNAGVMPYITSGVIFTTTGTTIIKNLVIDGNRTDNNTTNGLDYYNQTVTGAGRVCVPRIIGSTNGNITLENFTLQNLYTRETYPLHFNGVPAVMKNCKFYNIYTTGIGMYMGSTLEAKNCDFINVNKCFFFNNNLQKTLEDCYFENCNYTITLQNAQKVNTTSCEFFNCKQVITLYSNIYSSDIKYEDCLFSDCGYVLYATKLSKDRNTNTTVKEMKFDLAIRNNITFDGCEIYKTKTCAIYAESADNIWFNAMINVVDTAIIGCDGEKLIHANNVRFNFENTVLSGAKYGFYIIDGYANFSKYTEVKNCEYGLYITSSAQVICDSVIIENNKTGVYTDAHFTLNGGIISGNSICAINSNSNLASITITGGMIDASNGVISKDYGVEENIEYSIYTPGKIYISGDPIITAPIIANGFASSSIIDYGQSFKIVNNSTYPFKLDVNGNLIAGNRGATDRKVSSIEFIALRNATLSFDWISNSESGYDYFEVVYNNEQKIYRSGTGMTTAQNFIQAMEAGDIVRLVYYKDASSDGPGASSEGPIISNLSCISDFNKSLQATSSTISATRDTTSNYYATTSAAYTFVERSDGAIVNPNSHIASSTANYTINATRAFTLNFSYFVAAEANADWFTITYNSTQKVRINSTNGAFTNFSQAMNVGDTLTFTYTNDTGKTDKSNVVVIKGLQYVQPDGTSTSGTIAAPTILLGELNANSIVRFVVPKNVSGGDAIASAFGSSFDTAKAQNLAKAVYVDGWSDLHYISGSKAGVQLSIANTTETEWNQDFSSALYFDPNNSTSNANDNNSGRSYLDPLKTWAAVAAKNADGKYNVVIMSNWVIKDNTTIDLHGKTLSRYYINSSLKFTNNACITINGNATLTINNAKLNGNYIVNGVTACSQAYPFIKVSSKGKLIFNNGEAYNNSSTATGTNAGGVISSGGEVELNNVKFIDNVSISGGAIYIQDANLTLNNCYFENNYMTGNGNGGAVYIANTSTTENPIVLTINKTSFIANYAKGASNTAYSKGGAIYAKTNVSVYIDSCLFKDNYATQNGGAIRTEASNITSVINSVFENNYFITNSSKYGASIAISGSGNTTDTYIDGCKFINHISNSSIIDRYVLSVDASGDVIIKNSEFANNNVKWGVLRIANTISSVGQADWIFENVYMHDNRSTYNTTAADAVGCVVRIDHTQRTTDNIVFKDCVFEHNMLNTSGTTTYNNILFYFDIAGNLTFDNTKILNNSINCGQYLSEVNLKNGASLNINDTIYEGNTTAAAGGILHVKISSNNTVNSNNLIVENNIATRMVFIQDPADIILDTDKGNKVNFIGGNISNNSKCGSSNTVIGFALAFEDIFDFYMQGTTIKDNYNMGYSYAYCELSLYNVNGTIKDVILTGNTLQGSVLRFGSLSNLPNSVTIDNIYIADNRNTVGGITGQEYVGAGIYAREYENLEINNSIIENNKTTGYLGTGILGANSHIVLNNTIVRNNNSKTTSLDIVDNLIKTNVGFNDVNFAYAGISSVRGGGGVSVYGGNLTVNGGEISGNTSSGLAGGIMAYAPVLLNGTKVYNNASKIGGGMILTSDSTIINSEIYDNYASDYAGAIWLGAKLTITNSKVYNNRTQGDGAGIYTDLETSSLVIDGVVFENNTALGSGAGVYFENPLGTITLNNSEFINNTSDWLGTALYSEVEVNIKNTKFVANNINGYSLIHYGFVRSATLENVVISGNFGYGENATLFSFGAATSTGIPRFNIVNSSIYGNLTQKKALIEITNNLYLSILESTVYGNVNSGEDGKGGLISVLDGTFKLENGQLSNNFAANGGSIYFADGTSGLFINSVITGHSNGLNNYCQNGAVYIDIGADVKFIGGEVKDNFASNLNGVIYNNGLLEMTDTQIYNNLTNVGSIYNASAGVASFENVDIYDNTANKGAGIANFGILNFVSGAIVNNTAVDVINPDTTITYGEGGGVYNGDTGIFTLNGGKVSTNSAGYGGGVYNNGQFILNNGNVSNNTMTHSGGGIYNYISGQLTINGGEISFNTPKEGATSTSGFGIANAGSMVMNGGEISNNYTLTTSSTFASSKGGAIYGFTTSSHTRIIGGKIVDNAAELGAGIYLDAGAVLDVYDVTIDNETRLINSKIFGRAIYSNSSTVNLIDTTIKSSVSVNPNNCYGSIYAQDSNVNIRGCEFIANRENYGVITCLGGTLKVVDTLFNANKTTYDANTTSGIINLEGVNKFEFEDCNFISNQTSGSGVLRIKVTGKFTGLIDNCLFDSNTASKDGGAIALFSEVAGTNNSEFTINNSIFVKNNAGNNGGALYINGGNGATINLLNTVFGGWVDLNENEIVDNGEKYGNTAGNSGGAIYFAANETSPVSVVFKGEIEISYNTASTAGGVYYAYTNPSNTVENYYNLHLESGLYAYIMNNTSSRGDSNLYMVETADLRILSTGLNKDSEIGVTIVKNSGSNPNVGDVIIKSYNNNLPLNSTDFKAFVYDMGGFGLKLDSAQNQIILASVSYQESMIVIASDIVYGLDGKYKTVTNEDIKVVGVSDYTITYAKEENGVYSENAPRYMSKGEYTIWYKVVNNNNPQEEFKGSLILKITGKILVIKEAPTVSLNKDESLSQATFKGGMAISNGSSVSGTWAFADGNIKPSDTTQKYKLVFTPFNDDIYENEASIYVNVNISYYKVYYYSDRTNSAFYTDREHQVSTGIKSLSEMVSCMQENGIIFFMSTYTVGSTGVTEENVLSNNKIFMARYALHKDTPIISLPTNASTLKLSLGGGSGEIIIEARHGYAAYNETAPLFENYGILILNSNVSVSGFINTAGEASVVKNYGQLYLNGCQIYNNTSTSTTTNCKGGAIANYGENAIVYFNGGDYRLNKTQGSTTYHGFGGFMYNEGGTVIINGGFFVRNGDYSDARPASGGFLYTVGGNIIINGGTIMFNYAWRGYGGAIYATDNATIKLNGGSILINFASNGGPGIYVAEDTSEVIINGGEIKFNVLSTANILSETVVAGNEQKIDVLGVVINIVSMLICLSLVVFSVYFYLPKNKKFKIKK